MISPPFVSALAYIFLFGRRGLITHQLLGLSVNPYGWHGIVILQMIGSISFASLMLLPSFDHMDQRLVPGIQGSGRFAGKDTVFCDPSVGKAGDPFGAVHPVYHEPGRLWNAHRHWRKF